jgi:hypothetical protein
LFFFPISGHPRRHKKGGTRKAANRLSVRQRKASDRNRPAAGVGGSARLMGRDDGETTVTIEPSGFVRSLIVYNACRKLQRHKPAKSSGQCRTLSRCAASDPPNIE